MKLKVFEEMSGLDGSISFGEKRKSGLTAKGREKVISWRDRHRDRDRGRAGARAWVGLE